MNGDEAKSVRKSPKSPSSPIAQNDSDKSRKYDRQLRLWGEGGQHFIENSNVCLINANATGTEILKSLVLPGIGSFTIIDSNQVTDEDLGSNFFLTGDAIGKNRAMITTQLLLEMNPDVRGDYVEETVDSLLMSNATFFTSFSVVIAANVWNEKTLIKLAQLLWDENIPLLICNSYGFIGYIRLQIAQHVSVESHPDSTLEDLRLDVPFTALKAFLDSGLDLEKQSRKDLAHTPYLMILYKYLKLWQQQTDKKDDCFPSNFQEKLQLKTLISGAMNRLKQSTTCDTEIERELELTNFEEAIKAVNDKLVLSSHIPTETKAILEHSSVSETLHKKSRNLNFWLLVRALKEFMNTVGNGCLPVRGSIPDMTSDSERYIKLQKIYGNKAKEDVDSLLSCLHEVCNTLGLPVEISENSVKKFCKNAHCLRIVETSPLFAELGEKCEVSRVVLGRMRQIINSTDLNGDGTNDLIFYLMMRSVMRFYTMYNRFPGYCFDQVESDINTLKGCFKEVLSEFGFSSLSKDDYIHEMCRYGGCELASVSSFVGGCAAHEVIKLLTKQYVPLNNTVIYNAMTSTTSTFLW